MADTITLAIDALASAAFIEGGVSIERTNEAREYTEQRKRELIETIAASHPQAVAAQAAPAAVAVPDVLRSAFLKGWDERGKAHDLSPVPRHLVIEFMDEVFPDATPALPATEDSSAGDLAAVEDLAALVARLAHSLSQAAPDHDLPQEAMDHLARHGIAPSTLRTAQPAQAEVKAEPTDAEIIALNDGERFFSMSESRFGKDVNPHTQYHTGEPGYLQFARAVLARWGSALQAQPADTLDAETVKKAARYDWLRRNVGVYRTDYGKGAISAYLLSRVPASNTIAEETDLAIDAAMAAAQEGGNAAKEA